MARNRRQSRRRLTSAVFAAVRPLEALEGRVMFAATAVHNDSFDVTDLTELRANSAYSNITGKGVGIAVLDSGVDAANPELGNVAAFYNAVEDAIPTTITGSVGTPGTTVASAVDNDGHGTHVSGIAASTNQSIGVAYQATLVDVKVIADSGESQLSGDPLLRGLEFVADFATQFNIKVVNMSLGESTSSGGINANATPAADDISRAIRTLEAMGITVVTAAGNSYANDPTAGESYPADVSTIAVASTWSDNGIDYNNTGANYDFGTYAYGTAQDSYAASETSSAADQFSATSQRSTLANQVVAPGVDVYSDWNGSAADASSSDLLHNTLSGTSMATPFVSGLVALIQQAAYTYGGRYITDPEEVLSVIKASSTQVVDTTVAGDKRIPIQGGVQVSTQTSALPGTGDTFDRVNVLNAIKDVQQLFTGTVSNADTDNTEATATTVAALDGTAVLTETGNIGTDGLNDVGANDVDLYKLTLTSPGTLAAVLSGNETTFTADVRLFDGTGTQIASAAGTSAAGFPALTAGATTPLAVGTYYVGVSGAGNAAYSVADGSGATGGSTTGDYTLRLTLSNPDPNGVAQGAVAVDLTDPNYENQQTKAVANLFNGVLGSDPPPTGSTTRVSVPNGDVDMFKVVAPDTGTVTAQINATNYADGADTYVQAFTEDASGNVTVVASDGVSAGGASNSTVTFNVTLGDTYYVAVTTYANKGFSPTDPYDRLTNGTATQTQYDTYLSFDNGNANGTALLAAQATVGSTAAGSIASANAALGANGGFKYVNWYQYQTAAAGLLDLTATATTTGFNPNVQAWTLTTDATTGNTTIVQIGGVTGSGDGLFVPVMAQETVYVSVTGAGNENFNWFALASGTGGQTGSYSLASSMVSTATTATLNDNSIENGIPGTLTTGQAVSGNIGMDGGLITGGTDVDLYKFVPTTTAAYDLRTNTSQEGSADTVLRLFDASGNQIALNDNASDATTASLIHADLTAGTTYYLGVSGTGNSAYSAVDDSATADGSTGTYTLSAAVSTLPAVTIASPAAGTPGASLTFTVSIDADAAAAVTVDYATVDGTAVAGTDYTPTSGTLTIPAGSTSATITVPLLVDANATGETTFTLALSNVSGNAELDGGEATGTISYLPVESIPFGGHTRATYVDANGRTVVVSLAGPGSGTVTVVGDTGDVQSVSIAATDTTAASRLTIQPQGRGNATDLSGIAVTGSLGSLSGPAVDLQGDLTVTGTIRSLVLAGVSGSNTLSIDGTGSSAVLNLGTVSDLTVTSAEPIAELLDSSWTATTANIITAPSIKLLQSKGDFAAGLALAGGLAAARINGSLVGGTWTVGGAVGSISIRGNAAGSLSAASVKSLAVRGSLTGSTIALSAANAVDLGSLTVGGTLSGSSVRTVGSIRTVRAGAVSDSTVFAGVGAAVTALPTAASDFAAASSILSFTVAGGSPSFADSYVAAATLGHVIVDRVTTDNGGVPFGFAADTIASFADVEPGVATFRWTPKDGAAALTFNGDFKVRLV